MPYTEFVEQIAYYRQFRWGDDWEQTGVQSHAAVQPHIKKQMKPLDFIPKPPQPPQSPDYMLSFFKGLAEAQKQAKEQRGGR